MIIGVRCSLTQYERLKPIIQTEELKPILPMYTIKEFFQKYGIRLNFDEDSNNQDNEENFYDNNFRKLAYVEETNYITMLFYCDKRNVGNYIDGNGYEILFNDWINISNIDGKISNTLELPLEIIYQLKSCNSRPDNDIVELPPGSLEFKITTKRVLINSKNEDLTIVTPKAWEAIREANNPPVCFSYGGKAARLKNDNGRSTIELLDVDHLRDISAKSTNWRKGDATHHKPSYPPGKSVEKHACSTPSAS